MQERYPNHRMNHESGPETTGGSGQLIRVVSALLLLLVLYPLSVGPTAKIYGKPGLIVPKPVELFYSPIEYLYNHSEHTRRFFDWYLRSIWRIPRG